MSFDCYCALCSGPLGLWKISFGAAKRKALAKRRKRVENERRRLAREDVIHEDSEEWKQQEEKGDVNDPGRDASMDDVTGDHASIHAQAVAVMGDNCEQDNDHNRHWRYDQEWIAAIESETLSRGYAYDNDEQERYDNEEEERYSPTTSHESNSDDETAHCNHNNKLDFDDAASDHWSQASELSVVPYSPAPFDEASSEYTYSEHHTYDPIGLSRRDVKWMDRCRVLAINADLESGKRAFISGRGQYDESFGFIVEKYGSDPREPHWGKHMAHHCYDGDAETNTFPFHEECYKVLAKCLGYETKNGIDKDILHAVMTQKISKCKRMLDLDYGGIAGAEQWWICHSGQEWSVVDPGPKPDIEKVVESMLPAQLFSRPATQHLDLSAKIKTDPLKVLPYDVLHGIFANLLVKDALSLINASWHVFEATRGSEFWRQMIRLHLVPFFWELDGLLKNTAFPGAFDWEGAFYWLDKVTRPTFGMEGPLMAIANRRRIWNACQQLAPLYHEQVNEESYTESADADADSSVQMT
ncbi:hypothetical protein CC86DRAFT_80701 [Ophiobolus disseminans]|uniref:F-box domain-containing protein n=1 Tax=Ophiobolus disseminans TaxID=1469910 RepID=A0A6A6ZQN1_9PLEO|nr:hypothetical protein CC86DRAFT_80701 [Ophiobolus disseminans]